MTHKLYHVGIRTEGPIDRDKLEGAFDFAGDWLRLNEFNWYVWTSDSAVHLNALIHPLLGPSGSVVILPIDSSERWGFAPKAVWDWLDDKRDKLILGV